MAPAGIPSFPNHLIKESDSNEDRCQLGADRRRCDPEVCCDHVGKRRQSATVGVVLMVVGIVGLVLSLILANTARRTDVVHHAARGDIVEPTAGDDVRY